VASSCLRQSNHSGWEATAGGGRDRRQPSGEKEPAIRGRAHRAGRGACLQLDREERKLAVLGEELGNARDVLVGAPHHLPKPRKKP